MEEPQRAVANRPEYSAFISYSHADAAVVARLHGKLESYRLPRGVAQSGTVDGKGRGIGKVFRDREDLSAAENLSDAVTEALSRSRALVVVCSPEAAQSRWVAQEIDYFRKHCPGRPILAAVVRGDPPGVFPEGLTRGGTEPLAADLRKEGDGWKLGFLKVVAGIAGVPLDALVQRDSQRQVRRVMAVTGLSALVAVAMGAMTMVALQARGEAVQQRDAAEDLVSFMMNDLRRELKGVGRLDVMEAVNRRALSYYTDNSELSELPASSLEQRAAILHALGEDELKSEQADLALARSYFEQAHRYTQSTLERAPTEPDRVYAHGQSRFYLGLFEYGEKDWAGAGKWWQRYMDSAKRLQTLEGSSERAQREMVYAEGNLCTLAFEDAKAVEGSLMDHCARALDLMRAMIGNRTLTEQDAEDLINRLNWYAFALEKTGGSNEASAHFQRAEEIADELIEREPNNRDLQEIWLTIQIAIVRGMGGGRDAGQRGVRIREAERVAKNLVDTDPSNVNWAKRLEDIRGLRRAAGTAR